MRVVGLEARITNGNRHRSSGVRFSFQNGESPRSPKCESPALRRLNSFGITPVTPGTGDLLSPQHENSAPTTHAIQTGLPAAGELSSLPEIVQEDWKIVPCTPPAQIKQSQVFVVSTWKSELTEMNAIYGIDLAVGECTSM